MLSEIGQIPLDKVQQNLLRAITALDRAGEAIQIIDHVGKSTYHNLSFINLFGFSIDQLNETGGFYAILKDTETACTILEELEKKHNWVGKVQIYTLAGDLRSVQLRVHKIRHDYFAELGYICYYSNNLYLFNIFQNKSKYYNHIEEAEKLARLGFFSSVISHELNNPLNIIQTKLYFLQRELDSHVPKESEAWEHLGKIKLQLERLQKLAGSVLQYAKHSVKKDYLVNVNQILMRTLEFLEDHFSESILVRKELDPGLSLIPADATGMEIVFKNIIFNAIESLPGKGVIAIKTRNLDEKMIEICISDNGKGIPETLQNKIFDPFFTSKSKEGGYGLGLSICESIISEHNGEIFVKSQVGRGTLFIIRLPRI